MDDAVCLLDLFEAVKKKVNWILLAVCIGGGIAAGTAHFFIEPKYNSSIELMVSLPSADSATTKANEISTNLLLINTYNDMIKSNFIMDKVLENLNQIYGYDFKTTGEIKEAISVKTTEDSMLFSINAISNLPKKAQDIAQVSAEVFQKNAKSGLKNTIDEITILSNATKNKTKTSPSLKKYTLIGCAVGGVLCTVIIILIEIFDQKIKTEDFILEKLEEPLLGTISKIETGKEKNSRRFDKK